MRFLIWLAWTACCVAMGIGLATIKIDGVTSWERMTSAWTREQPELRAKLGDAHQKLLGKLNERPSERHTPADRDELNKLIARRARN